MSEASSKIYLYCIFNKQKHIDYSSIIGIENKEVFQISYKDIFAAVSEVSGTKRDIKNEILNHEKTIEKIMAFSDVLPFRFNTILKNEAAVYDILENKYIKFQKNFRKIKDKTEYGLKAIWDYDKIKNGISKNNLISSSEKISKNSAASQYLKEKFLNYKLDSMIEKEADKYIEQINSYLNEYVQEKKIKKFQTQNLFLNAAYLVNKNEVGDLKLAFSKLKNVFSKDIKFLFTGPWPPYNFIEI